MTTDKFQRNVSLGRVTLSNDLPIALIAGPCVMESRDHAMFMARELFAISRDTGASFIFKTSFDKANRTSGTSFRGMDIPRAMDVFREIKDEFGCPVVTDVHTERQCDVVAEVVDMLQIPAFLCRQTDLLVAAARTGRAVNVKKGQFLAPWDMRSVAQKIEGAGNPNVLFCERGTSFGYNTLVNDMRGLDVMRDMGYPVVFDATHSVQEPGALGDRTGGKREHVPSLARAAAAVGVAALFVETHQDPDCAPSDGPNMLRLTDVGRLLEAVMQIDRIAKSFLQEQRSYA
jgi:2-dehydro-3-deoxyphosphooctonate aldolase (KDO 8-P synthase)